MKMARPLVDIVSMGESVCAYVSVVRGVGVKEVKG